MSESTDRLSSQLFPIWVVALFAASLYFVLHILIGDSKRVPCELKQLTMLSLAIVPMATVFVLTGIGLWFAQSRRPLGVVTARIYAHVARVIFALVVAGFSLAVLAVAIRGWAMIATLSNQPIHDRTLRGISLTNAVPQECTRALPADFLRDQPVATGLILVVGFGFVTYLFVTRIFRRQPRWAARLLKWLPSPILRWITFIGLLVWPTLLVIDGVAEAGFGFLLKNSGVVAKMLVVAVGSAGAVAWWATGRVFGGLALITAAAHEYDDYNSSPRAGYDTKLATSDRADVLVFSDMHLTASSQGHPLRTMDRKTESFDDATSVLVEDLIARVKPSAIMVAGDVTDTGHPSSWERATKLLKRPEIPTYVAPGNHDVHFRWLTPELVDQRGAKRLVLGEVFAMDQPHDSSRDSVGEAELAGYLDAITPAGRRVEGTSFPILHVNDDLRLLVLILDSNRRPPSSPISNAIGLVGPDQLATGCELLCDRPPGYGLVIILHHHVVPPDDLEDHASLRCEDAREVLDFAVAHKAVAVIHGHKHMPYALRHSVGPHALWVISCGSTLYDAVGPRAKDVKHASAVGLTVRDGTITDVVFFPANTRPHQH